MAAGGNGPGHAAASGRLMVCPTPIGNLEDVTLRVLRALREADVVAYGAASVVRIDGQARAPAKP